MFDSFFDSIFEDVIHQQFDAEKKLDQMAEDMEKRKQEDIDILKDNHHNNAHEGHITVTGIKDIKNDEVLNVPYETFSQNPELKIPMENSFAKSTEMPSNIE
jgi:hypothetical protein